MAAPVGMALKRASTPGGGGDEENDRRRSSRRSQASGAAVAGEHSGAGSANLLQHEGRHGAGLGSQQHENGLSHSWDANHRSSQEGSRDGPPGESGSAANGSTPNTRSGKLKQERRAGGGRSEKALAVLTERFHELVCKSEDGTVDLNHASATLGIPKRRIYDVINVLEGIGLVEKTSKNRIMWKGAKEQSQLGRLKAEEFELVQADRLLEQRLQLAKQLLMSETNDLQTSEDAFVFVDEVRSIPAFAREKLLFVRAPSGARLEVPHPDMGLGSDDPRRYEIHLSSKDGQIEVLKSEGEELAKLENQPVDYFLSKMDESETLSDLYGDS
mmetsp:Transcript_16555/g.46728  ORF Transcript_16555/g.46728 Transcript_16555/m.46728 type:complete len:329 (+) Transcript_16555:111-1097(+)